MGTQPSQFVNWPVTLEGVEFSNFEDLTQRLHQLPELFLKYGSEHVLMMCEPGASRLVAKTSGSTGPPKESVFEAEQVEASVQMTAKALGLWPGMRTLLCLDSKPIGGRMVILRALMLGLDLCVCEPRANPSRPGPDERFHLTSIAPKQLQTLVEEDPEKLVRMGTVLVGGATIDPEIEALAAQINPLIFHTYGMTETLSHIALRKLGEPHFRALPGVILSQDTEGCLVIQCPQTKNTTITTNDFVEFHSPTTFTYLGRRDFVINTGGFKVLPELIENQLRSQFPGIDLGITSRPSKEWGMEIVLVSTQPIDLEKANIAPRYATPKSQITVEQLPKTETGKLDRNALARLLD